MCTIIKQKIGVTMKKTILVLAVTTALSSVAVNAEYQHGWKVYKNPQPGYSYGGTEVNPYGRGGSKSYAPGGGRSYAPGGGRSYGAGGGRSYGAGGGNSYGIGGGKNPSNPWRVAP